MDKIDAFDRLRQISTEVSVLELLHDFGFNGPKVAEIKHMMHELMFNLKDQIIVERSLKE